MKQLTSFESGATVDVDKLVSLLGNAYSTLINNNKPVTVFPSVMLWGQPGVGKSQAIRQIAKLIEEQTHKRVDVTDVRLLLFNPIDLSFQAVLRAWGLIIAVGASWFLPWYKNNA